MKTITTPMLFCNGITFLKKIALIIICIFAFPEVSGAMEQESDGFYIIASAEDFTEFAGLINNSDNKKLNARVVKDLDLSGVTAFIQTFAGEFDGGWHTIRNYNLTSGQYEVLGMFGTVNEDASIHGFTLKNCSFSNTGSSANASAGVIGETALSKPYYMGKVNISCIGNEGDVSSTVYAGGILGRNSSASCQVTIENCYTTGTIDGQHSAQICPALKIDGDYDYISHCWSTASAADFCKPSGYRFFFCYSTVESVSGKLTELEIASGKLCYNINNNNIWFQTIGTDPHPVFCNGVSKRVYFNTTENTFHNMSLVTLDARGGIGGTESVEVLKGFKEMPEAVMPTRKGFTFNGYFDAPDGGRKYYNADGSSASSWQLSADATLYACWTPVGYSWCGSRNSDISDSGNWLYNNQPAAQTPSSPHGVIISASVCSPDNSHSAIPHMPSITSGTTELDGIYIEAGATLTIGGNARVKAGTVSGEGSLVVNQNPSDMCQLIVAEGSPTVTVNRSFERDRAYYIGNMVDGTTSGYPQTEYGDILDVYNPTTLKFESNDTFWPRQDWPSCLVINIGNPTAVITQTGSMLNDEIFSTSTVGDSWFLMSNPFMSAIKASGVLEDNASLHPTLFVRNKDRHHYYWTTYNGIAGVVINGTDANETTDMLIAPGQAFFVRADGEDNSTVTLSRPTEFAELAVALKSGEVNRAVLKITGNTVDGTSPNEIALIFCDGGSVESLAVESRLYSADGVQLFQVKGNRKNVIALMPPTDEVEKHPIIIGVQMSRKVNEGTVCVPDARGVADHIWLHDMVTDAVVDLATGNPYRFSQPAGSVNSSRFEIELENSTPDGHTITGSRNFESDGRAACKLLRDGALIIEKDGFLYNLSGVRIR